MAGIVVETGVSQGMGKTKRGWRWWYTAHRQARIDIEKWNEIGCPLLLGKLITIQAWTERGLNPEGYLVCRRTFKVRWKVYYIVSSADTSLSSVYPTSRWSSHATPPTRMPATGATKTRVGTVRKATVA